MLKNNVVVLDLVEFQARRIGKKLNEVNGRHPHDPFGFTQLRLLTGNLWKPNVPVLKVLRQIEKDVDRHLTNMENCLKEID